MNSMRTTRLIAMLTSLLLLAPLASAADTQEVEFRTPPGGNPPSCDGDVGVKCSYTHCYTGYNDSGDYGHHCAKNECYVWISGDCRVVSGLALLQAQGFDSA